MAVTVVDLDTAGASPGWPRPWPSWACAACLPSRWRLPASRALSVYATEPCPWSGIDVAAVGADAGVVAEQVRASMALGARDAEVAELTQT
jgi:hypothetical protein